MEEAIAEEVDFLEGSQLEVEAEAEAEQLPLAQSIRFGKESLTLKVL